MDNGLSIHEKAKQLHSPLVLFTALLVEFGDGGSSSKEDFEEDDEAW